MARRAPAVERAVAVLNLLASRAGDRFTLSEIARDLDLNKATLHAILAGLTERGYLVRDPAKKTYGLGPALIALGNSALDSHPAVHYAVPEMRTLSDELGLDCVASAAIHDEIVILARAGTPRPFGIFVQPGQRLPLAPPLGTVFVAWSGPERIDRWLGRVGPNITDENVDRYRRAVETVRARGYSLGLEADAEGRLVRALRSRGGRGRASLAEGVEGLRNQEYALNELDNSASYRLNHIGAPVFGPDGDVAIALFLIGFHDQLPAEDVPLYADKLRGAASRVTHAIGGREP